MGIYEGFGEDNQWGEGLLPSESRVRDYMYLSLQLLQNMKPLMTLEEARQNYEINGKRKEQNTLTYITYNEIKIQEEKK